jgi:hypothetical protein
MVGLKKRLSYMGEAGNPAGGWGGVGGGGDHSFSEVGNIMAQKVIYYHVYICISFQKK